LGTNTVGQYVDMGSTNLNLAKNNGAKILMWHGLADQSIPFQQNIYYYNEVVDHYGGLNNVTDWFRFFLAPGVTHCGGGVGPQPQGLFDVMVKWRENGVVPHSILAANINPGPDPVITRTRPLCPFPQTAIYDGPNAYDMTHFHCGGNLQTKEMKCDGLLVKYKHETGTAYQPLSGEDDISCGFASMPLTRASVSPTAVNGWYRQPRVTLNASDPDADLDRTEYRLDGASAWTSYTGPFPVSGDGSHAVEYRSTDKGEHVEPTHTLALKIDTTAPMISGMPAACSIWPPNNKLVQVAALSTADSLSDVAPGALSVAVTANEPLDDSDVVISGGVVQVRATRAGKGTGRVYTIASHVSDLAGNVTATTATCTVPHDRSKK
jgi:tannase/feruloyl esterase